MKKKLIIITILASLILPLVGCKNKEEEKDSIKFKKEYESLNKQEKEDGSLYRTISVDEENPIIYTTYEKLANIINDGETFLVYFGTNSNEYCRTMVPYMLQQAKTQGIDKIYYVDTSKKEETTSEGAKAISIEEQFYTDILNKLNQESLEDSTMAVFVKGNMISKTTGISSKQKTSTDELTKEMKEEMLAKFKELYITYNSNRK